MFIHMEITVDQALQEGIEANHAGNLQRAEQLYRAILAVQPNNPEANHNLGILAVGVGRLRDALPYLKLAVNENPNNARFWVDYIHTLVQTKEFGTAKCELDAALTLGLSSEIVAQLMRMKNEIIQATDIGRDMKKRSVKKNAAQRTVRSSTSNRQLISPTPHEINDLLKAYNARNFQLAEKIAISFTRKYPNDGFGWNCLGVIQKNSGRTIAAEQNYRKAIEIKPDYADAYCNLGNLLRDQKRFDEALVCCFEAIRLCPNLAEGHNNLGNVLKDLDRLSDAEASFREAIRLQPTLPEAHYNLGNILKSAGRLMDAVSSYRHSIKLRPNYVEAYCNLGNVLREQKHFDEALVCFTNAIKINPEIDWMLGDKIHTNMYLCNWDSLSIDLEELKDKVARKKKVCTPFVALGITDDPDLHKAIAEIYVNDKCPSKDICFDNANISKNKKIKVGYYSGDFHSHATMHLMAELFENHNRDKFELYAFSFGPQINDKWNLRCKNAFDYYVECNNKSDTEVAQLSRQLGIDIAVDLKGFTTDSRTGIFANRAAPIQVNFLGYPGTAGAEYIDYLIGDKVITPESNYALYTEKLVLMPNCYQPNCRHREISTSPISRTSFGLPEQAIVFSSFNNNYKITPSIFATWMQILKAVEGSVLWLLSTNATAEKNLRKYAAESNVDPDRLIFAQNVSVEDHLNRMTLADMMLDTFPYGAHTTCSDALRVGLPVISLFGKSFASRVATSLLNAVGVAELSARSLEEYEAKAIDLALNPVKLTAIKKHLEANRLTSPLFNPELFAGYLETAYLAMYQRYRNGMAATHLYIDRNGNVST